MPEGVMPQPGAPPAGGAAAPPPGGEGQQLAGPGGASMPTPNRGLEAAAMAKLAVVVQQMQMLLAVMPVGSDISRDMREALNKVAKHVPPGAVSQGVQMSETQRALMQQRQNGPQIAAMRAMAPAGGQPPAQPSPPPQQPQAA